VLQIKKQSAKNGQAKNIKHQKENLNKKQETNLTIMMQMFRGRKSIT